MQWLTLHWTFGGLLNFYWRQWQLLAGLGATQEAPEQLAPNLYAKYAFSNFVPTLSDFLPLTLEMLFCRQWQLLSILAAPKKGSGRTRACGSTATVPARQLRGGQAERDHEGEALPP